MIGTWDRRQGLLQPEPEYCGCPPLQLAGHGPGLRKCAECREISLNRNWILTGSAVCTKEVISLSQGEATRLACSPLSLMAWVHLSNTL